MYSTFWRLTPSSPFLCAKPLCSLFHLSLASHGMVFSFHSSQDPSVISDILRSMPSVRIKGAGKVEYITTSRRWRYKGNSGSELRKGKCMMRRSLLQQKALALRLREGPERIKAEVLGDCAKVALPPHAAPVNPPACSPDGPYNCLPLAQAFHLSLLDESFSKACAAGFVAQD